MTEAEETKPEVETDQDAKETEKDEAKEDDSKAKKRAPPGDSHSNLFVSGLPTDCDETEVRELFGEHGVIVSTRLYTRDCYGFVKFAEAAEAQEAIEAKNGHEYRGQKLIVRFANKDGKQDNEGADSGGRKWREKGTGGEELKNLDHSNLYVGGLPTTMDENGLKEIFEGAGTVVSVRIIQKEESGSMASQGYGFVKMDKFEEATKAIQTLQGHKIDDKVLVVRFANSDLKDKEGKGKAKGKGKYDQGYGFSGASGGKGYGGKGGKGFDNGKGSWGNSGNSGWGDGFSKGYDKGSGGGKGFDSWGKGFDSWGKGKGFDSWGKGKGDDKGFSGAPSYPAKGPSKGKAKDSGSEDPRPRATSKQIIEAFQSLEGSWEGHDSKGTEQWHELTFQPNMDSPENSQIVDRTWTKGKVGNQPSHKIIYYKDGDILYGNGQIFLDMVSTRMALWKDWYRPEMQWKWMRRQQS